MLTTLDAIVRRLADAYEPDPSIQNRRLAGLFERNTLCVFTHAWTASAFTGC